ncbi:unnamed protein product [Closterium sp. Naga37s-1]|nr:unnamed protein product [Closterium sp. Naga37s-1]
MVEQDPRVERTREESEEEAKQEDGDEPVYDDEQGYGDERELGDAQEHSDKREHGDEREYGGERELGDEQEDDDSQEDSDEQTRAVPHVPSGTVEELRAPSAEHADTAAAARAGEGEVRAEGPRATAPNRLGGHHARDVLPQEGRTREKEARTVQPRGMRGWGEAEDTRATGAQRRRGEPREGGSRSMKEPPPRTGRSGGTEGRREGVEEKGVRAATRPWAPRGGRDGEDRSPEPQRRWEGQRRGGSHSPRGQRRWGKGPHGEEQSPERHHWREGRREEADRASPGTRRLGRAREEWSPPRARRQLREAGPSEWERNHHSPKRQWGRTEREGSQWGQSGETR